MKSRWEFRKLIDFYKQNRSHIEFKLEQFISIVDIYEF